MESLTQAADQAAPFQAGCADDSVEHKIDKVDDVGRLSNKDSEGNSRQDEGVGDVFHHRNQDKDEVEEKRRGAPSLAHLFGPSSSNYTKFSISRALCHTVQSFLTRQGAKGSLNDQKDTGQKVFCQYLSLRGLDCDVGLDMAYVQRAMFAANIPTHFEEGIAPNEVVCALGPVGGDIWMKNEGQDLIMFHEGFDNAALSRSQRHNLEKLDIIQHTLIGTKEDALEWLINGAYTRGQFAQQQILNAASPPPAEDHDKHIDEALTLFRDKSLDAADPDRLQSIVRAWPLAQEVRQFVEGQMLFLIHLVANNGIETILRRITSKDISEPNIGILSKQDRKTGVIPLPRSVLQPAVGPGNIIAEDNEPKIVELEEDDNVVNPEAKEHEIAPLKDRVEAQEAAQKHAQKAAHKAAQKEKKARLKANRRAKLGAEEEVKKTEEDKMKDVTSGPDAAKHMGLTATFKVDDRKQQEGSKFESGRKLELAEKSKVENLGRAQQDGRCEKLKFADGSEQTFAQATTSARKDNVLEQVIPIMVSPTQRATKKARTQKRAGLRNSQEKNNDFELTKHLEFGRQQKIGQEVGIFEVEFELPQQGIKSSSTTRHFTNAQWERVTKDAKTETTAEVKRKQSLSRDVEAARIVKAAVLTKQKEMARAEKLEKKRASTQNQASLKVAKDAEADRNYDLANQQQEPTSVRVPRSDGKRNVSQPVNNHAPVHHISNEKINTPQPARKSFAPTYIAKNDENVNTLQHARTEIMPKTNLKRPQEGKRIAPLGNPFPGLHVENQAETSDLSGKKLIAAPSAKAAKNATANNTTLESALKVKSTAEFPSLDGGTAPSKASAFAVPGSALAWLNPTITGVTITTMSPAVSKPSAFPALGGSISQVKPPTNVFVGVGSSSSWSDAVGCVAPETFVPARIERPNDFPDLDSSIAVTKSSANNVGAIESSIWSKTAAGRITPTAAKKLVESTTEFPTLEVSTTQIKTSAIAIVGVEGDLSWSNISASQTAPGTPPVAIEKPREIPACNGGSTENEYSAKVVGTEKPSNLTIVSKSKDSVILKRKGESRYDCSACKEKYGDFPNLLRHLKAEPNHCNVEVKLVYDAEGEKVVIWANKPHATHDPKTTNFISNEVAQHNESPLALIKAPLEALPVLDGGTIVTEVPVEMNRRRQNVSLSSFSNPETTIAEPKVTSTVSLPRPKIIDNHSHISGASKLTFGSLEVAGQVSGATVLDKADAKDNNTVTNSSAEMFGLNPTVSSFTPDASTTVNLPILPVAESSPLIPTKTHAEAGKMKRRDSINFIRTRTDSRAAQLGSPLGPAGQAPSTPPTPLALAYSDVSASATSACEKASAQVPEWRKQGPIVASKQSEFQEQQVDVKRKAMAKPVYQFPAFQFPSSLAFFGDISSSESTGVERSQKPKATRATPPASRPMTFNTAPESSPAAPAALKPFSSAVATIAAAKRPIFHTATAEDLERMRVRSQCFACRKDGHTQIDCSSFIDLATDIAVISSGETTRHAVDVLAPKRLIETATTEEYAEMSGHGLCFACGDPDHAETSCPFFKDTSPNVLRPAAKWNFERVPVIATSSNGRHAVDDFPPLAQISTAEQLAGMRARGQCLACESREPEKAGCPHYGATRVVIPAVNAAPAMSRNNEVVVYRKVGPPLKVAVRNTTATVSAALSVFQTRASMVSLDTSLAIRVTAPPIKVVPHALRAGQTLNEIRIEDRSTFLERMATLICGRIPAGQPGGEVVHLKISQKGGDTEVMTMVLPERRVFKHKRSKSFGDKLDNEISYYTKQEQEHFLRNQFFECKHTPGTRKGDDRYCSVHDGADPMAYCELDDADDLANGEPYARRNSISLPHLEGNPDKIPDGSGAFIRTHKRAPAALVSRIETSASCAPVTKNVHVFCGFIGL